MRIHRISIKNFRNFKTLDVLVGDQVVIVRENKIGKTNLMHALRLVLDPSLPDSARQLRKTDFWDGLGNTLTSDHIIEVSVELTEFEADENLLAVLAEHLVQPEPMIARLTYVYQPLSSLERSPSSEADYEFFIFGGDRKDNRAGYEIRRRIPIDVLPALRDAEGDLASWSRSPLRPLLDEATKNIDRHKLGEIAENVLAASNTVLDVSNMRKANGSTDSASTETRLETDSGQDDSEINPDERPLRVLAIRISRRLTNMVGAGQALDTALGFSSTDPEQLLHAIRLFIDGGKRSIGDASLGSANLLYLTLKSIELEQLAQLGQRDHTFLAIEEPEAHLHPHLQRLVYRDFLDRRSHQDIGEDTSTAPSRFQTILLTTHSPHIVSVAPVRSIVLLKRSADGTHTVGASAVQIALDPKEIEDIERYLDVSRGEMLFAKGVVLVEGVAEEYLIPVFAKFLGFDFDELGISVCSVSGTNFRPYIKLLGYEGFNIPFVVLTDRDPRSDGQESPGNTRVLDLLQKVISSEEYAELSTDQNRLKRAEEYGFFLNTHTLEIDLFESGCHSKMCQTIIELTTNGAAEGRATGWKSAPDTLNKEQFIKDISAIGKGRFAQRLAGYLEVDCCPSYIMGAIEYVANKCQ